MAWPALKKAMTRVEVADYIRASDLSWADKVVIHNTDAPDLAKYADYQTRAKPVTDDQWMENLRHEYQDRKRPRWSGCPHFFVVPKLKGLLAMNRIDAPGTHSPSFNEDGIGIELVGNYDYDKFDSGAGALVRDNAVFLTGEILKRMGLQANDKTIRFHREDPRTSHKNCPGKNVVKADFIARVKSYIERGALAPVILPAPPSPPVKPAPVATTPYSLGKKDLELCLKYVSLEEGGYREHADEHGGGAGRGVSLTLYKTYCKKWGWPEPTLEDLKKITQEVANKIFTEEFVGPCHWHELQAGLDLCVLDTAVNTGPSRAMRLLREALGYPLPIIPRPWSNVLWAVKNLGVAKLPPEQRNLPALINRYQDARLALYKTYTRPSGGWKNPLYAKVWGGRIDVRTRARALKMAAA